MLELLTTVVEHYGYFAVFLFVTLEGFGIPLPGEAAVVTAAAVASRGSLNVYGVALAASLGALIGGTGGYWVGRRGGRGFVLRHGHWLRLTPERLTKAEGYFERHGGKTVFLARFVAMLRILGSLMAGVTQMPFGFFSVVNLAGGIVWAATFSALGFLFGKNLPLLEDYVQEVTIGVSVLIVVGLGGYWLYRRRSPAEGAREGS